jgi:hypothetical protein
MGNLRTVDGATGGRTPAASSADARCIALTREHRRCRNRCEAGQDACRVHIGLDLSDPDPDVKRDFVVIDRAGVARKVLPGGRMGEAVEPDPNAPARKPDPSGNRVRVTICRCGCGFRERVPADHRCEVAPRTDGAGTFMPRDGDPVGVFEGVRWVWRGGIPARADAPPRTAPARGPGRAVNLETTPNDAGPPTPPPPKIVEPRPNLVRSTGEAPAKPTAEPERTYGPENWLS